MSIKNKKVLITGADGFVGSHLLEALTKEGCRVRALIYYNSFNSWGWLDSFDKKYLSTVEIFPADIRDPYIVKQAVAGMDIVFHLAALIGIPFSYHAPDCYVDTNIKGTLNILQSCRSAGVEKVLVTSTSEVYGTALYVPIDECHTRQPQSPYSATKIAADALAESFYRSFNLPVTIVRPFNTYGPRQSARAVIPTIITQLLAGNHKICLGNLHPTRDMLFVKDLVDGFIEIAKTDKTIGEEINIATQKEISIENLAQKIINLINPKARLVTKKIRVRPINSEVERLLGSNTKIKRLTKWRPKYDLDKGLRETINWFKNNLNLYKPNVYNV